MVDDMVLEFGLGLTRPYKTCL